MVAIALPRTPLLTTRARHRGIGGARRGAAAARRARARHGRVRGLGRGRQASPPGAERRARPARRRHRGSSSAPRWRAPATALPDRRPRVVCVARHFPVKGVDVLVEAFPQVLAAVPGAGLVLVGGGAGHRRADRARRRARHRRRRALRRACQLNPAPYLRAAPTSWCFPSRREGLPVVGARGARARRAVVATAVGGTPDVVRPGETGWLVPPEQPAALAAAHRRGPARSGGARAPRAARAARSCERSYSIAVDDRPHRGALRRARRPSAGPTRSAPPTSPRAPTSARASRGPGCARRLVAACASSATTASPPRVDSLAVSPARFREQMRAVAESGAQPIRLDRAIELLRGAGARAATSA